MQIVSQPCTRVNIKNEWTIHTTPKTVTLRCTRKLEIKESIKSREYTQQLAKLTKRLCNMYLKFVPLANTEITHYV